MIGPARPYRFAFAHGWLLLLAVGGGLASATPSDAEWEGELRAAFEAAAQAGTVEPLLALERQVRANLLEGQPDLYCDRVARISDRADKWRGRSAESARLYSIVMKAQRDVRERTQVRKWCQLVWSLTGYASPWRVRDGGPAEALEVWGARRSELAALMLESIKAVRDGIDPNLDPADLTNWPGPVHPPSGESADPERIQDETKRSAYVEALAEKHRKERVVYEQGLLRGLDKMNAPRLLTRIVGMYKHEPPAPDELEEFSRSPSLTSDERAPLLAMAAQKREGN